VVPDAREVIAALQTLGKKVFIVSGGLRDAVLDFGEWLGVPRAHIYAVSIAYNQLSGEWWHYHTRNDAETFLAIEDDTLAASGGKIEVIKEIRSKHKGRAMLIGDGLSDLEARAAVDLFVGFGGAVRRARVKSDADVFVATPHLSPILPLSASRAVPDSELLKDGLKRMKQKEVTFRHCEMEEAFLKSRR